jgi:broad specificity phosphatase PhoE
LSRVYLVRHGQAGTRDAYDSLSDLGKRQARLLGEHFIPQNIRFAAAYVGGLSRQQQTAEQVAATFAEAGVSFPSLTIDRGWDEFDLSRVYQQIAPQLAQEDANFRREYEDMRAQVGASAETHGASIHRRWLPCDTKVVQAWIRGLYAYKGETWEQFRDRVTACRLKMNGIERHQNFIVFTSATPISIWTGLSLDIFDDRVMRLAGALYNASYTVLRLREEQLRLHSFNAVPHLATPELCTWR